MIARLARLLVVKQRALLRHQFRSLRTPRSWFGIASVGLFVYFVWRASSARGSTLSRESVEVLGAMLFVMSIASGFVQQGPRFTPSDVDFLFPAPFTPRQLLVWRLMHQWLFSLVPATAFFLTMGRTAPHPLRFFLGVYLLQLVALHAQVAIAVLVTKLGDVGARRLRGAGKAVAMVALFGAVLYLVQSVAVSGGVPSIVATALRSSAAKLLLFPALWCTEFVFAATTGDALRALASLIVALAATLALVLLPDVDYLEDSVATTARFSRLLASRRRSGAITVVEEGQRARSVALPAFRLLFRASGAIVWKNLLVAVRSWKSVLPSVAIGAMSVLPLVYVQQHDQTGWVVVAPLAMVTLFWSSAIAFDLRREIDRLDQLRLLPLHSSAIVLAELLLPWATGVVLQEAIVATLALTGRVRAASLGYVALGLPLVTFVAIVIDNLSALLFAQRGQVGATRGAFGSGAAAQLLRMLAWVVAVAPGVLVGRELLELGSELHVAIAVGVSLEGALAAVLFFLLVRLYERREVDVGE